MPFRSYASLGNFRIWNKFLLINLKIVGRAPQARIFHWFSLIFIGFYWFSLVFHWFFEDFSLVFLYAPMSAKRAGREHGRRRSPRIKGGTVRNRSYTYNRFPEVARRNKTPSLGSFKFFRARLKILSALRRNFETRHKILKRVLGRSGRVLKYRGRANFPIFSFKKFSWNFRKFQKIWKKYSRARFFFFARFGR